jgi:hypothetical protein
MDNKGNKGNNHHRGNTFAANGIHWSSDYEDDGLAGHPYTPSTVPVRLETRGGLTIPYVVVSEPPPGRFDYLWEDLGEADEDLDLDADFDADFDGDVDDDFDVYADEQYDSPLPWYRTKVAMVAIGAIGAAVIAILVSAVLLVSSRSGGRSGVEEPLPTTISPTAVTTPSTSATVPPSPTVTPSSSEPPASAPVVVAPTHEPPPPTAPPEIGVTRTPATRSPISVSPQPHPAHPHY